MKWLVIILLFFLSMLAQADVYQTIDSNGNLVYSDVPFDKNSKKIDENAETATQISTFKPPTSVKTTIVSTPGVTVINTKEVRKPYTTFAIEWPRNQETIQNEPIFFVKLNIDPPLQLNDKIQVYIDGAAISEPIAQTEFKVENLNRGQHTVSAAIIDSNGNKILATKDNTIYNHRAHLGVPPS